MVDQGPVPALSHMKQSEENKIVPKQQTCGSHIPTDPSVNDFCSVH